MLEHFARAALQCLCRLKAERPPQRDQIFVDSPIKEISSFLSLNSCKNSWNFGVRPAELRKNYPNIVEPSTTSSLCTFTIEKVQSSDSHLLRKSDETYLEVPGVLSTFCRDCGTSARCNTFVYLISSSRTFSAFSS